jgi:hypothetical protein
LAWGNTSGLVSVLDLEAMKREVNAVEKGQGQQP